MAPAVSAVLKDILSSQFITAIKSEAHFISAFYWTFLKTRLILIFYFLDSFEREEKFQAVGQAVILYFSFALGLFSQNKVLNDNWDQSMVVNLQLWSHEGNV